MTLLAACCWGVLAALVVAALTGHELAPLRLARPRLPAGAGRGWLREAGVPVTPLQFAAGSLGAGVLTFTTLALMTGTPLVAAVPAAGVALLPRAYFARRRTARLRAVHAAWPDGLRDLTASIASGRSLTSALHVLAGSGPEPLRHAFARFSDLARVLGTVGALDVIRDELADPTSDRVLEVLALAHERGGAVVKDVLEDLVVATTSDLKLLHEVDTDGLEMRLNTRAVLVLPWLALVALTVRPGPFRDFYRSGAGVLVIAGGAALSVLGAVLITRLARVAPEPRVLGSR